MPTRYAGAWPKVSTSLPIQERHDVETELDQMIRERLIPQVPLMPSVVAPTIANWQPRTPIDLIWAITPQGPQPKIGLIGCKNCQTGGGTATAEGGLGSAPGGQLLGVDKLTNGQLCWRLANDSDWRVDRRTNTTNLLYDPAGFREVGIMAYRSPSQGVGTYCTFVRIAPRFVLTAAHCIAQRGEAGKPVTVNTERLKLLLFAIPKDLESNQRTRQLDKCWDQPDDCGFHVGNRKGVPVLYRTTVWKSNRAGDRPVPSPDLAVIEVKFGADAPTAIARLPESWSMSSSVYTTLGYGKTDRKEIADDGNPIVGWSGYKGITLAESDLVYLVNRSSETSRPCFGDSGGALYGQPQNGSSQEDRPRVLTAIVSGAMGLNPQRDSVSQCVTAPLGRIQALAGHRHWICEVTGNTAEGCK